MADANKWCNNVKTTLKENTRQRINHRITVLSNLIQTKLQSLGYNASKFTIDSSMQNKILQNIMEIINQKTFGNNFMAAISSQKQCSKIICSWWNRHKPINLANHLFNPILFEMLFFHVITDKQIIKTEPHITKRFILFIEMFICILQKEIKFPRTRGLPIILYGCFITKNKFKTHCESFIKHFGNGIEWDLCYSNTNDRSKKAANTFIGALQKMQCSIKFQSQKVTKQQIEEWFSLHTFFSQNKVLKNKIILLLNGYIRVIEKNVLFKDSVVPFELNKLIFLYVFNDGICCEKRSPNVSIISDDCAQIPTQQPTYMRPLSTPSANINMYSEYQPLLYVNNAVLPMISNATEKQIQSNSNLHCPYKIMDLRCPYNDVDCYLFHSPYHNYYESYNQQSMNWQNISNININYPSQNSDNINYNEIVTYSNNGNQHRQFQSTNNFVDLLNRIHQVSSTQPRDRKQAVESYIKQMGANSWGSN